MKLFIVATLVAVASAARLEHLERSYLPPDSRGPSSNGFGNNQYSPSNGFGAGPNDHGSNGFGSANVGSNGFGANAGATSNQYLPPNYQSAGSNGFSGHGASLSEQSAQAPSQQYNQDSQYSSPRSFGSNSSPSQWSTGGSSGQSFGSQGSFPSQGSFGSQPENHAASRQYLAPKTSSSQDIPQQAFDEQTGYQY